MLNKKVWGLLKRASASRSLLTVIINIDFINIKRTEGEFYKLG